MTPDPETKSEEMLNANISNIQINNSIRHEQPTTEGSPSAASPSVSASHAASLNPVQAPAAAPGPAQAEPVDQKKSAATDEEAKTSKVNSIPEQTDAEVVDSIGNQPKT